MRKASLRRDFRNGLVSFGKLLAGELHSELSNIAADGAAVVAVERAREMSGMNTYEIGEFAKFWRVSKMGLRRAVS